MPEPTQYMFKHRELVEVMIKHAGIHEGKWVLSVNFGLAAINSGPNEDEVVPTAMVPVQGIGILRAPDGAPRGLVVDAAESNPAPKSK